MNKMIQTAVISVTAAALLAAAPFSCAFTPDDGASLFAYADEEEMIPEVETGTEDVKSFDSDPTLKLDSEDPEDPSEDPQAPIQDWPGIKESNKSPVTFLVNSKGKRYEYRKLAKQKLYGYDTFQGACSHGKYSYHILYNRVKQKCRVIKVSIKSHKVLKISKPLPLDHGNDMTYDTKRNRLIVVHYGKHPMRLSIIDPIKLTVIAKKNVKTPTERLSGASTKFSKSISGMTGIGYDPVADEYITSIMGTRHYMVLNRKFKPVRVIKVPDIGHYMRQGMTVTDGFIIRSFSADKKPYNQNILFVYDFAGNFVKTVKLGKGFEIESIYFSGTTLYASTYRSYLKKVVKKVKKRVRVKVHGRYKYVRKKVRVVRYKLRRDNNIIKIEEY